MKVSRSHPFLQNYSGWGRRTGDTSSRVTQAKGNALGLFHLACPALAGLKEVLGSQGLVDTNVFWNSSEKEMSLEKHWYGTIWSMISLVLNGQFCKGLPPGQNFIGDFRLPAILPLCWKKNLLLAAGTLWKLEQWWPWCPRDNTHLHNWVQRACVFMCMCILQSKKVCLQPLRLQWVTALIITSSTVEAEAAAVS